MIACDRVTAVLLGAGYSRRFGPGDKLVHPLHGRPLVRHAADRLAKISFAAHIAVARRPVASLLPPPFEVVINREPERGLSHSIALGVAALHSRDVDACLIALADMPFVPTAHFERLLAQFTKGGEDRIATRSCKRVQVPAIFGRSHFDSLLALTGDSGARALLRDAPSIPCEAALLADFDRPEDFLQD